MRIILVRHGETGTANAGRYIGASDPALSARGREQAVALGQRLPATGLGRCLCSPLRRARETADLALSGRDCRPQTLDCLREIDFGRWEGLSFAEIVQQDAGLVADWQRDPAAFRFPGGESTTAFRQRLRETACSLASLNDESVLVVCHGGVIRALLCHYLDLAFDRYLAFQIEPATMTVLEVEGERGLLMGLNL